MASTKDWAEGAAPGDVTDPGGALRTTGYIANAVPAHEHHNWILREHGRGLIRRFATAEDFIDSEDDYGIVEPSALASTQALYSEQWSVASAAGLVSMCADGRYLWAADAASIIRHNRMTGVAASLGVANNSGYVCCAGGNVYSMDDPGNIFLRARSRATLATLYSVDTGAAAAPTAIATDGKYVACAVNTTLYLYEDTGAALTLVGSWPHGAAINSIAMNGEFIIYGGVTGIGGASAGDQLVQLTYVPGYVNGITRTNNATVLRVDFNGTQIVFYGDIDAGMKYGGVYSLPESWTAEWLDDTTRGDVKFVEDGLAAVVSTDRILLLSNGTARTAATAGLRWAERSVEWDIGGGVAVPTLIAFDHDGLFVYGTGADGAGKRLKRYLINQDARLYRKAAPSEQFRAQSGLLQPVR